MRHPDGIALNLVWEDSQCRLLPQPRRLNNSIYAQAAVASTMDSIFNQVLARADDYPRTILRPLRPHEYHERNSRSEQLKQGQNDLFEATDQKMELWETGRNNSSYPYFVPHTHTIKFPQSAKFGR